MSLKESKIYVYFKAFSLKSHYKFCYQYMYLFTCSIRFMYLVLWEKSFINISLKHINLCSVLSLRLQCSDNYIKDKREHNVTQYAAVVL